MKIAIGCDHAGYEVKEKVKQYLAEKLSFEILDIGTYSLESVDYPTFGHKVGMEVAEKNKKSTKKIICKIIYNFFINLKIKNKKLIKFFLCLIKMISLSLIKT